LATVLIVEDEFLVQNVLQIELEEADYDVILADNADPCNSRSPRGHPSGLRRHRYARLDGRIEVSRLRAGAMATNSHHHYDGQC
jgi:hypothetical protein